MQWKINKYYMFWVWVCSLSYPSCKAHVPYCIVICDLSVCTIFSTVFHTRQDFRKKVTEHNTCVLIFSTNFVWNISHTKENWARYYHKYRHVFITSTCYSCQVLMKLEFSLSNFRKILKYQIWWKFVQCKPNCSGLTNRETNRTKLIIDIRNFSRAPKNETSIVCNFFTQYIEIAGSIHYYLWYP